MATTATQTDDSRGLLIIKASAGSGKTFTLAKRYIEQLLFKSGPDGLLVPRDEPGYHAHILAITFTNKATEEMKSRIVKQLAILADPAGNSEYLPYFEQRCRPEAFARIHEVAHSALMALLFDYDAFNVSTIDSFFQSVVRTFARELDRDYNYEVQIDTQLAYSQAIHNFLLSLGRDNATADRHDTSTGQWVKQFIKQQVSSDKTWDFFGYKSGLLSFTQNLSKELFHEQMPAIEEYLTGNGRTDLTRINKFAGALRQVIDGFAGQFAGLHTRFVELSGRYGFDENNVFKGRLAEKFLSPDTYTVEQMEKFYSSKSTGLFSYLGRDDYKSLFKGFKPTGELNEAISRFLADTAELIAIYKYCQYLGDNLGKIGLLGTINRFLQDYCRDTNTLLIDDTNDLIATILRSGSHFIYERVGTWINHYMIDEFQDTSRKQYNNFGPLLDDSLAQDNFNMLIGDAKQSIYRFRNADPEVFRTCVEQDLGARVNRDIHHDNLETNYRSHRAVVEFNNDLFAGLARSFGDYPKVGAIYADLNARVDTRKDAKAPGLVVVSYSDPSLKLLTGSRDVTAFLPRYLLWLHERHAWRDIGILVNRVDEGAEVVQRILEYNKTEDVQQRPINVMSSESMYLSNSPAVRRIIGLLRLLDVSLLDEVDPSEAEVIDNQAIPTDQLTPYQRTVRRQLREQRRYAVLGRFIDMMKQHRDAEPEEAGRLLTECFDEIKPLAGRPVNEQLAAYNELLADILPNPDNEMLTLTNITDLIIRKYLPADELNHSETAFVMTFQSMVANFCSQHNGGTVREFLRYWDNGKRPSVAATDEDAIQVMTIHKSKGLEFDCVVIPFGCWAMDHPQRSNDYWLTRRQWKDYGLNTIFDRAGVPIDDELIPPLVPLRPSDAQYITSLQDYDKGQVEDAVVDNMNKTYVAFTRPRQELHVFCIKNTSGDLEDVMNADLVSRLPEMRQLTADEVPCYTPTDNDGNNGPEGEDRDGSGWFVRGKVQQVPKQDKPSHVERRDSPPYFVESSIAMPEVALPFGAIALDESDAGKDLGRRLHTVMEHIITADDVDHAIATALNRGVLTTDPDKPYNEAHARRIITQMMSNPQARPWFAPGLTVFIERSMVDVENRRHIYRPDRIVIDPSSGHCIIIDYKFAAHEDKHIEQVRHYIDLLRRQGIGHVDGYLFYGLENHIEAVTPL